MSHSEQIGYLYINGLGEGTTTPKDKLVKWWWRRAGLDIEHAHIDWYDGASLGEKLDTIERQAHKILRDFGGLALIGSSAGGSLAINVFYRLLDKKICAVSAHGRLRAGNYPDNDRMSLHHRAHLDSNKPSQSFYDSVIMAETQVIPNLSEQDKKRLLVLTQLTDLVVPLDTVSIEGVQQHRSIALGHSGGFVAHFLADRDIISDFANERLLSQQAI